MKKILGILTLLVVVSLLTALATDRFLTGYNLENLLRRTALFGILSIGASFVIMTAGIDLSIGSIVCLVGCLTPYLLVGEGWSIGATLVFVIAVALAIGVAHGFLITRVKLQPFVVTLCGLLMYRGITRGITADRTQGFLNEYEGLRSIGNGRIPTGIEGFSIPAPVVTLVIIAVFASIFLNKTVWGRYLLAIGRNETAARYSGVDTKKMTLLAYVLCALLSGIGGVLFVCDVGSAQPSDFGNFYELYAIAAAVLGGCSLRGGEGTVIGVIIGAAVMQVLRNSITLIEAIPDNVEFAVIGAVILAGSIVDESVKGVVARRGGR
jgi:ribose transport system permease protein